MSLDDVLRLTWRQVDALRKRWQQCPPIDRSLAALIRYRPPVEFNDLPEGGFEEARQEHADWFANPSRFFEPAPNKQTVSLPADGR